MRCISLVLLLALIATPALAQSYEVYSSQSACQTRSQQQCTSLGCDGVQTKFWWACVGPLSPGLIGPTAVTAGSYGLRIDPGTPFDVTTTNTVSPSAVGLNATEQGKLVTAAQVASLLPVSVGP